MEEIYRLLADIRKELLRIEPIREGMHDYWRLDLTSEAKTEVNNALALYDTRWNQLKAAEAALEVLLELKPITLPPVSRAVHDSLVDQEKTITTALREFKMTDEAVAVSIEWGTPEDQPK
jgi:hypothetical protein